MVVSMYSFDYDMDYVFTNYNMLDDVDSGSNRNTVGCKKSISDVRVKGRWFAIVKTR